jgi:glycosyltransferase involved in cell wall biosynthesis
MKISLACIAGNEELVVDRFLDTFQPHFDEVIIVRAIGNQKPDRTIDIARRRGCVICEYLNQNKEWPHVDDFAAARNAAFEEATGDWVVWADLDDIAEGLETLRPDLEKLPPEVLMLQAPYVVPDQRIAFNMRERAVRRGSFKWVGAVHEFLSPVDPQQYPYVSSDRVRWIHAPLASRDTKARAERNIRILESLETQTAGELYYLFSEYSQHEGKQELALPVAQKFLAHPDAGDVEKYEVFHLLASMCDSPETIASFLHQAYRIAPHRAEALYELANLELTAGNPQRGLAYIRSAQALPLPAKKDWNLRSEFYGHSGRSLLWQAMRMTGESGHANALEFNSWVQAGGDISLLHATRGRPEQASRCRALWLDRATQPEKIEHIFAVDQNDDESNALLRFRSVVCPVGGGCVAAWNQAAKVSSGQILLQLSDDWIPPRGWDEELRRRLDTSKEQVLQISDGNRNDDLLCMAILTRKRHEKQGYLFHPDFTGVFSDNWFTDCAHRDGVIVPAKDLVFEHAHPVFGKGQMDATYEKQNSIPAYKYNQAVYEGLKNG